MGECRPAFPRGSAKCRQGTAAPCPGPARHFQFQGVGAKLQLLLGHTMPSTPAASTARLAWGARPAQPNAFGMAGKDCQQRHPCCAIVHAATCTPGVREGGAPSRTCTLAASLLGNHPANWPCSAGNLQHYPACETCSQSTEVPNLGLGSYSQHLKMQAEAPWPWHSHGLNCQLAHNPTPSWQGSKASATCPSRGSRCSFEAPSIAICEALQQGHLGSRCKQLRPRQEACNSDRKGARRSADCRHHHENTPRNMPRVRPHGAPKLWLLAPRPRRHGLPLLHHPKQTPTR